MRKNADYWERKISVYLHDPLDKALEIRGHESRAQALCQVFQVGYPDEPLEGDWLAAALDRAMFPGYHREEELSGAVEFTQDPCLTHPTGENDPLRLQLAPISAPEVTKSAVALINTDLNRLSNAWQGDHVTFSFVKFLYLHLVLRHRLAENNIGGLGALWHRLPADTRIPDHSIWHHNALAAALDTCQREGQGPALLVYSLGPVQAALAKARKLRDFWTGSVLISWLAFEGLRTVVEYWGPDHVIYPSLVDQPLLDQYLTRQYRFEGLVEAKSGVKGKRDFQVASFPNKFVLLVPVGQEAETAECVRQAVKEAWRRLGEACLEYLLDQLYTLKKQDLEAIKKLLDKFPDRNGLRSRLEPQFRSQVEGFWEHAWTSLPLLKAPHRDLVKQALAGNFPEDFWRYAESSLSLSPYSQPIRHGACGHFYPVSHQLVQAGLAAAKNTRLDEQPPQEGIKCSMDPDFSILTVQPGENPSPREDLLWAALREAINPDSEVEESDAVIKDSERLSAIGCIKRFAWRAARKESFRGHEEHYKQKRLQVLDTIFYRGPRGFPSTTEMALSDWFTEWAIEAGLRRQIAQALHDDPREDDSESASPRQELKARFPQINGAAWKSPLFGERYYALVVMDGDRMGKLVQGETLASRWKTVIHPDLAAKLSRKQSNLAAAHPDLVKHWHQYGDKPRALSPAVHAAISESLGDFAIYGVSALVRHHRGRLIYAGGDDVCAVFPVSEVVPAVLKIASRYRQGYVFYPDGDEIQGVWSPGTGKLSVHLGRGKDLSISAGVVIAHHKAPLMQVYQQAQSLLKGYAKDRLDRNAMALALLKRGGVPRYVGFKFTRYGQIQSPWQDFLDLAAILGRSEKKKPQLAGSLIYRLETMQEGLKALANDPSKFTTFLAYQVDHSGLSRELWPDDKERETKTLELAAHMTRVALRDGVFHPETLIVARFLGQRLTWAASLDSREEQ